MKKLLAIGFIAVMVVVTGAQFASAETGYGGGTRSYGSRSSAAAKANANDNARFNRDGEVLGAETDTPNCTAYLTTFMRIGQANDAADVTRLQTFLNEHMGKTIPTTGFFGPITEGAVKEFQLKYKDEVLTPWGMTEPSGYVYKTTQRKINMIKCPSLALPEVETN